MPNWEQLAQPSLLMTAGMALLVTVFLRLAWRRMARSRPANEAPARSELSSFAPANHGAKSSSAEAYEAQLHETARALCAQVDSKVILLEQWIRLARLEAERLERAVAAARAQGLLDEATTDRAIPSAEHLR
ncbi:MAG: hypothetical protein KF708_07525 [Pirellulales bacterium]|nr:hypothetical protein [Pirellulales bacterium]